MSSNQFTKPGDYNINLNTAMTSSNVNNNNNNIESTRRKRKKNNFEYGDNTSFQTLDVNNIDPAAFDVPFPLEYRERFASAIFEIGLKNSSPKVLFALMPEFNKLNTEHIKSHLQKYRIRSKEEFLNFYRKYIREQFEEFEENKGWELLQKEESSSSSPGNVLGAGGGSGGELGNTSPTLDTSHPNAHVNAHNTDWAELSTKALGGLYSAEQTYKDWTALYEGMQKDDKIPNSLLLQQQEHFKLQIAHLNDTQKDLPMLASNHDQQGAIGTVFEDTDRNPFSLDPSSLGLFTVDITRHDHTLEALNASNKILMRSSHGEK